MPDIVSARPVSGEAIATAWGDEVHDAIEGIQAGVATIASMASGSGFITVTFPRPYVTPPVVVATGPGNTFIFAQVGLITTTNFVAYIRDARDAGTATGSNVVVNWMAIGKPA